jgi:hypothetical protein
MTLRGPDFFIVGAPKCGTTAMTDYLGQHPEVGMCERKETQQFATDLHPRFKRWDGRWSTQDEYRRLFKGVQDRKRLGEASVWYLYSSAAPREIKYFCPAADIIAMLRNPSEMLPSLHSQFLVQAIEPVESFERALALDEERERSGAPHGFVPRSYRSAAQYAEQLRRYIDVFGRDKVHVIIYDGFRDRTLDTYRATCEFLGVDPGFVPEIRVVNPNKRVRSRTLRNFQQRTPAPVRGVLHVATPRALRRKTGSIITRWNTSVEPREPVPDRVAKSLRPLVAREVSELRGLLGVDLSFWLE